jgi:hypothetical protein
VEVEVDNKVIHDFWNIVFMIGNRSIEKLREGDWNCGSSRQSACFASAKP